MGKTTGFYKDRKGKTRPITSRTSASKKKSNAKVKVRRGSDFISATSVMGKKLLLTHEEYEEARKRSARQESKQETNMTRKPELISATSIMGKKLFLTHKEYEKALKRAEK